MRNNNFAIALLVAGITIVTAFSGCIGGNETESNFIPTEHPTAAISASAHSTLAGGDEPIVFDASNSTGDIVSYSWDFGDGSTGAGSTIEHAYADVGYYTVNLAIVDASGNSDTTSMQVAAFTPLENSVTEWTDPKDYGITYPDEIKSELLVRPVFIFFWHEGCQWCTAQEAEANELVDSMYMGKVAIFKANTHTEDGRKWAKEYIPLAGVPTNFFIRQDGMFKAGVGMATFPDLQSNLDEIVQFKIDNAEKLNITEIAQDGVVSPASPVPQNPIDIKNGTAVLSIYINWDKAQDYNLAAINSLNIILTAPNGTKYDAAQMQFYDPTKQEVPGNYRPDPYRYITIANPMAGTWNAEVVASGVGGAAPAATMFTIHIMTRGGSASGCHDGVCPP
jgi:hypothetical protein